MLYVDYISINLGNKVFVSIKKILLEKWKKIWQHGKMFSANITNKGLTTSTSVPIVVSWPMHPTQSHL